MYPFWRVPTDIAMKYVGIEHFNHLLGALQRYHQVQTNMTGNKIVGLNVQWDFPSKQVCIDMKSYVNDLLLSLNLLQHRLNMAKNPVHSRQRHIGSSVARMHQSHSKNYQVSPVLCTSCRQ